MIEFDENTFAGIIAEYEEWNSKINVVSRKDSGNLYAHHILHSLAIARYLHLKGEDCRGLSFLDVGTGGGFPGIPLATVMPDCAFTLCDSIGKKIRVASAVARSAGLRNVECVNCRAETLSGPYDYVVSRAVTSLENFYPWVKGKFSRGILYLKGGDVNSEIAAMCAKFRLDPSSVTVWPISEWLDDEYFQEKFVIDIKK